MNEKHSKGRVVGVGGIFFKSADKDALKAWYSKHLGLPTDEYGTLFETTDSGTGSKTYLQWSPFEEETKYFEPSDKEFMINYRVVHIEKLVEQLKEAGVKILDTIEEYEYGKFVHILDPENNKIELWEPPAQAF